MFQTLDSQFPTPASWQSVIVQAFQTWAAQTNLSIGLTTDSGAPFGVAGLMQGDSRFGDIRIGARPLSPDVMAITVPPDPYFSGTLSGDMILNSSADLNPGDLFAVVLHEAGLALGLGESTDPDFGHVLVPQPAGHAVAGRHPEHPGPLRRTRARTRTVPTARFATATQISEPPALPRADAAGRLRRPHHALGYRLLLGATARSSIPGPVTIQLQTSGISFLQPQLDVYDQNFNLLGQAQSTSDVRGCRVGPSPERQSLRTLLHRGGQPRAGRLRDRSLRPVGHVQRPDRS